MKRKQEKRTYKIGDISEAFFIGEAIKNKFIVSKPFGNAEKYDFVLDFKNKLIRVQVKTANFFDKKCIGGRYMANIFSGKFHSAKKYNKKDVDYICLYVPATADWYIIPTNKLDSLHISVYPHRNSNAKYEKFKNAWKILK